jgi:hypothetical protein
MHALFGTQMDREFHRKRDRHKKEPLEGEIGAEIDKERGTTDKHNRHKMHAHLHGRNCNTKENSGQAHEEIGMNGSAQEE